MHLSKIENITINECNQSMFIHVYYKFLPFLIYLLGFASIPYVNSSAYK